MRPNNIKTMLMGCHHSYNHCESSPSSFDECPVSASGAIRIRPAPFPGRKSWKVTKSGFSFLCLFCVKVYLSSRWMSAFVASGLVSSVLAKRLPGKKRLRNTYLCWAGQKTLTQGQTHLMNTDSASTGLQCSDHKNPLGLSLHAFFYHPHSPSPFIIIT